MIWTAADRYLGHKTITFEEIAGKGKNQLTFNQIALEQAAPYAAEDADVTLQLHLAMWPQLKQSAELLTVFNEIEMPLLPVLSHIERTGVLIDPAILSAHSQELAKRLAELEAQAHELAEEPFNGVDQAAAGYLVRKTKAAGAEETRAGRHPPTKRCWPSWRSTIRCRK